jgi:hypothetical protein
MLLAAEDSKRQSDDMRRAIAWERYKDLAAARQAAKERKHPSVTYGQANRSRDTEETTGRPMKNPPPADRKDRPER